MSLYVGHHVFEICCYNLILSIGNLKRDMEGRALSQDISHSENVDSENDVRPVGDICTGCLELAERIEQLERQFGQIRAQSDLLPLEPPVPRISTWACFAICVAVPSIAMFVCLAGDNEYLAIFLYVLLTGSAATVSMCHALVLRPMLQRVARYLFAIVCVCGFACLGCLAGGSSEPQELFALGVFVTPTALLGGVFTAILFRWIRGWSIAVPHGEPGTQKLQIRDLLVLTAVVAGSLAAMRFVVGDTDTDSLLESLLMGVYAMVPVILATIPTVMIGRYMLDRRSGIRYGKIAIVFGVFWIVGTFCYLGLIMASSGVSQIELSTLVTLLVQTGVSCLMILGFPMFTFMMM